MNGKPPACGHAVPFRTAIRAKRNVMRSEGSGRPARRCSRWEDGRPVVRGQHDAGRHGIAEGRKRERIGNGRRRCCVMRGAERAGVLGLPAVLSRSAMSGAGIGRTALMTDRVGACVRVLNGQGSQARGCRYELDVEPEDRQANGQQAVQRPEKGRLVPPIPFLPVCRVHFGFVHSSAILKRNAAKCPCRRDLLFFPPRRVTL